MRGWSVPALALGFTGCGQGEADPHCPLSAPECRRNVLAACGDAGVVIETPCEPGRCAFDAPVPQCVPAGALPCDPLDTPPTCENGLLLECAPETAYRLAVDCGAGQLCVSLHGEARCEALEGQPCTPATFQPLCVGGRRIECTRPQGRLVEAGRCAGAP